MKPKIPRPQAYWGLHFDFHAAESTRGIGTVTTRENIAKWLDEAQPEFVQIDTKGHPGLTSFFSEYGYVAPGLEVDQLKLFREETAKRGIALIAHHSGLWDVAAGKAHPEWCVINREGKILPEIMNPDSPYAEQKLIPQLKELAGKYGLDGAWIDGDIWCLEELYNPEVLEAFRAKTGISEIPPEIEHPSHIAFREFCLERFEAYLKRVIDGVHQEYPDFAITSNWAYSTHQFTKPLPEMDYLSGDATGSYLRAANRIFAVQNKPWDLMVWGGQACFKSEEGGFFPSGTRHVSQICRAGAQTVSLGGGFQVVNALTAQGGLRTLEVNAMKQVKDFLEARREWNYQSKPVNNAALLFSEHDMLCKGPASTFSNFCNYLLQAFDLMLEGGRPYDVIMEYQILEEDFGGRKTIILPEIKFMKPEVKEKLLKFAENGGNLVACGRDTVKLFSEEVGVTATDFKGFALYVEPKSQPGYMYAFSRGATELKGEGETLCNAYLDNMDRSAQPLQQALKVPYGSGSITLIGLDFFSEYHDTSLHFVLRTILRDIMDVLEPDPAAKVVGGSDRVEVIPARKGNKLLVNLINTIEYSQYRYAVDVGEVPPLHGEITVAVPFAGTPKSIFLEPEHTVPEYTAENGRLLIKVTDIPLHTILVIEG